MHKYRGTNTCLRCGHVKGTRVGGRGVAGSTIGSQPVDAGSRPADRSNDVRGDKVGLAKQEARKQTFEDVLNRWRAKAAEEQRREAAYRGDEILTRWKLPGQE